MDSPLTDQPLTADVVEHMRHVHQQGMLWRALAAAMREDSQRLRAQAQQLLTRSRAIVQQMPTYARQP
jgi:hypothetical protein